MTDFTSSDERCLAVEKKLAEARAKMKRLGIPSLLHGHKGWQTINPMAAPTKPATVTPIRRRK